ncbi:hypothetical protein EIN_016290 [Entamoeba invadens IP1]|uniref:hypothetical protein n=1 Tax=Entamoeba invadens IP1 TaxID=370355 RepID=UPI0002C3DAF6|nr:hypothetical protein EIN_016290 [Entamoeba invadens IP1]ELP90410.1 hypothetical protein EIN_016290 [Entamoeba invadens IP1]|eukprot:XP_004257181.1 hypothetical protein EIN_016290 [Entamoeba invadens IP1]
MPKEQKLIPVLIEKDEEYRKAENEVKLAFEQRKLIDMTWKQHKHFKNQSLYDKKKQAVAESPEYKKEEEDILQLYQNIDELIVTLCNNNTSLLSRYAYIYTRFRVEVEDMTVTPEIVDVFVKYIGEQNIYTHHLEVFPNKDKIHQVTKLYFTFKNFQAEDLLDKVCDKFYWYSLSEYTYQQELMLCEGKKNQRLRTRFENTQENFNQIFTDLYEKIENYTKDKKLTDKIIRVIKFVEDTPVKMFKVLISQDFEQYIDKIKESLVKDDFWVE